MTLSSPRKHLTTAWISGCLFALWRRYAQARLRRVLLVRFARLAFASLAKERISCALVRGLVYLAPAALRFPAGSFTVMCFVNGSFLVFLFANMPFRAVNREPFGSVTYRSAGSAWRMRPHQSLGRNQIYCALAEACNANSCIFFLIQINSPLRKHCRNGLKFCV